MKKIWVSLVLLGLLMPVFGQEVSKKQDLTLLPMSIYGPTLDKRVIASVDSRIKEVFVNLGRFNVIGLTTRLDGLDANTFIQNIRDMKSTNITIPEAVKFGDAAFTEKDYNALVGSFIVVIPQITNFSVERDGKKYKAIVETSFTFLRGSDLSAIKVANVSTQSSEKTEGEAVSTAIGQIPAQLTFEIRSIPEFQLTTGVLEVKGSDVILELGKDLGVQMGDEYALQSKSQMAGFDKVDEIGLLIIKDVQPKFSVAQVIYGSPYMGDPLQEIPRFGVDMEGYFYYGMRTPLEAGYTKYGDYEKPDSFPSGIIGLKFTQSRGVFNLRPTVNLELPLGSWSQMGLLGFAFIPANIWVGGDLITYLGRMELNLGASLGGTAVYFLWDDAEDPVTYTHFGAKAEGSLGFLLNRDSKLKVTAGGQFMLGAGPAWLADYFKSYIQTFVGLNYVYKY